MCWCRFLDYKERSAPTGHGDSGEALGMEGEAGIRKLSVPSTQLCCEPETPLKIQVYFVKWFYSCIYFSV